MKKWLIFSCLFPNGNMGGAMDIGEREAQEFGRLIRERRKLLGMRQEDVVLATGVGRRYLIELEAGKPTARLGLALMVARQLGISMVQEPATDADMPDILPSEE